MDCQILLTVTTPESRVPSLPEPREPSQTLPQPRQQMAHEMTQ